MSEAIPYEWRVRCRRCGTWRYVPSMARDCETRCADLGIALQDVTGTRHYSLAQSSL